MVNKLLQLSILSVIAMSRYSNKLKKKQTQLAYFTRVQQLKKIDLWQMPFRGIHAISPYFCLLDLVQHLINFNKDSYNSVNINIKNAATRFL